jgi:hypothetical protein
MIFSPMLLKLLERDSPTGYSTVSESPQRSRSRSLACPSDGSDICDLSSGESDTDLSHIANAYDDSVTITFCPLTAKPPLHPSSLKVISNAHELPKDNKTRKLRPKVLNRPLRRPLSSLIQFNSVL